MKKIVFGLLVFFGLSDAYGITCTLSRENPQISSQYDQSIFVDREFLKKESKHEFVLVKPDLSLDEKFADGKLTDRADQTTIKQSILVMVARNDRGQFSLGLGGLRERAGNLSIVGYATALGSLEQALLVIDHQHRLLLQCKK